MDTPADNTPQRKLDITDEHIVNLGRFFFRLYCKEKSIPHDQECMQAPQPFMLWLSEALGTVTPEVLMEQTKASRDSVDYFMSLPHVGFGLSQLNAMWPFLSLANRSSMHDVETVNFMTVIQFKDGTVTPITMVAHADAIKHDSTIDDATVVHLIITRCPGMAGLISAEGLDKLHDSTKSLPNFSQENLNAMQEMLHNTMGEYPAEQQVVFTNIMKFVRCLFPGRLTPEQIKMVRQQQEA